VQIILLSLCLPMSVASASYMLTNYVYARVQTDGVMLYKTPSVLTEDNVYFEIPKSYFVLLISNFSTEYYKVQYRDVVGYITKESVAPVVETPQTPYLTGITFRVFSSDGLDMLSSPYSSSSPTIVKSVELYQNIDYYGKCYGDEYIEGRGNVWYYGKCEKFGYLYSGLCDNLSPIYQNTEVTTISTNPFDEKDNDYLYNLIDLSLGMKIFLIILVSLPAIAFVILLFKPFRIEKSKLKTRLQPKKAKAKVVNEIEQMSEDNY